MDEPDIIKREISAISRDMTPDEVMEVRNKVLVFLNRAKDLKQDFDAMLLEYIQEHGSFEWGGMRFYAGAKKTTKCPNVPRTAESILRAVEGDLERFCGFLGSNPFRHGAAREPLGDAWGEHFTVTTTPDLKTGKPKLEAQSMPINLNR